MHQTSRGQAAKSVRSVLYVLLILLALLFVSCYPGQPLNTSDLDVVVTLYDTHANFSTKHTYAMPDSVIHIADSSENKIEVGRQYDALILSEINKNMVKAGFTRVANTIQADVLVLPTASLTIYVGYTPGYWYWGGWFYPPPPGGGWYYPYPPGQVYTYPIGTLFIDMVDPVDTTQKRIPSIWTAALNGLADGAVTTSTRITNGISQAFIQSPYLKEGK